MILMGFIASDWILGYQNPHENGGLSDIGHIDQFVSLHQFLTYFLTLGLSKKYQARNQSCIFGKYLSININMVLNQLLAGMDFSHG